MNIDNILFEGVPLLKKVSTGDKIVILLSYIEHLENKLDTMKKEKYKREIYKIEENKTDDLGLWFNF
jgi:precorrin-6B methylase 2